jgi:hypothetical protein
MPPAGTVNDADRGFHLRDGFPTDEMLGFGSFRDVEGDKIGLGKE